MRAVLATVLVAGGLATATPASAGCYVGPPLNTITGCNPACHAANIVLATLDAGWMNCGL